MQSSPLPLVSIILPVYNEQALLRKNVVQICDYVNTLLDRYRFEILIVNDGSADNSGQIADELSNEFSIVNVLHHPTNFGAGQALKFGFSNTRGDYVVVLDVDLSYDVQHIDQLVDTMRESHAKIVLASPYKDGGSVTNVPAVRKTLSIFGNRFLKFFNYGNISTITCMVRAYNGQFIRAMDFRSTGLDLMPESIYKAMVLRAKIVEIPARLDWGPQLEFTENRTSSMRLIRQIASTIMSSFLLRPMFFFIILGVAVGVFALYSNFLMFGHYFNALADIRAADNSAPLGRALRVAYANAPHAFVFAMLSTMLSIQLLGLGILSLQSKRNYEDLYYLNSHKMHALKKSMEEHNNEL